MGWQDWVGPAMGAAAGAADAQSSQKAYNDYLARAGKVNLTTTNNPWAPSIDARTAGMAHATDLMNRAEYQYQPNQRGGGGGGGGRGSQPAAFNGQSGDTAAIIAQMRDRATQGSGYYGPAMGFTNDLMSGKTSGNPYADQAFNAMKGINSQSDPALARYQAMLFGDDAGGQGFGGSGGGGFNASYQSQPGNNEGVTGAAAFIKGKLGETYSENPQLQAELDMLQRRQNKNYQENVIPRINDQFTQNGMGGSSAWTGAMGNAEGQWSQAIADAQTQATYQDYKDWNDRQQGYSGQGAQYDENLINANTSRANAAMSANASAGNAGTAANAQMQIARMNALGNAVGMGLDMTKFGASGQAGLSGAYDQKQMAALGLVPSLSGMDVRDMSAAGQLSLGSDQARNTAQGNANQMRAANAANSNQRSALEWQKQMYSMEAPWQHAQDNANLINSYSQGGGTQNVSGTDYRGLQPMRPATSTASGAMQGGLGGMGLGDLLKMFGGGSGGQGGGKPGQGGPAGGGNQDPYGNPYGGGGYNSDGTLVGSGGQYNPDGTNYYDNQDPNSFWYTPSDAGTYSGGNGGPQYGPPSGSGGDYYDDQDPNSFWFDAPTGGGDGYNYY